VRYGDSSNLVDRWSIGVRGEVRAGHPEIRAGAADGASGPSVMRANIKGSSTKSNSGSRRHRAT
jgi:hypothetical protein